MDNDKPDNQMENDANKMDNDRMKPYNQMENDANKIDNDRMKPDNQMENEHKSEKTHIKKDIQKNANKKEKENEKRKENANLTEYENQIKKTQTDNAEQLGNENQEENVDQTENKNQIKKTQMDTAEQMEKENQMKNDKMKTDNKSETGNKMEKNGKMETDEKPETGSTSLNNSAETEIKSGSNREGERMSKPQSEVPQVKGSVGGRKRKSELQPEVSTMSGTEGLHKRMPGKGSPSTDEEKERMPGKGVLASDGKDKSLLFSSEKRDKEKIMILERRLNKLEGREWWFYVGCLLTFILAVIVSVFINMTFNEPQESSPLSPETINKVTNVEKLLRKLDKIEEKNAEYDRDIRNINKKLSILVDTDKAYSLKTLIEETRSEIDALTSKGKKTEEELTETAKSLKTLKEETRSEIDALTSKGKKIEEELKDSKDLLGVKLSKLENNMTAKINEQERKMEEVKEKFDPAIEDVKRIKKTELPKIQEDIQKKVDQMKKLDEALEDHESLLSLLRENAFNKAMLMYVVMFLLLSTVCLMISVIVLCRRSPGHSMAVPVNGTRGHQSQNSILQQIQWNQPLSNAICVISYDEDNVAFNQKLVEQGLGNVRGNLKIIRCVIRQHNDILNLPPCKLTVMCVEFSERHVIIEQPGIAQGDLRKTTYEALKKIGGKIMIVYTRDPGSVNLRNEVYNTRDVYCVGSQLELVELHQAGRFFSVKDSFSNFQISKFREAINNIFSM